MPKIDPRNLDLLDDDFDAEDAPERDRKPATSAAKQQRRQADKVRGKAISGFLKDLKKDRRQGKP